MNPLTQPLSGGRPRRRPVITPANPKTYGAQRRGGDDSPNWNHSRSSDHPPTPGLWAVEPHLGKDGVGAKFEEILVITETDAGWLDDGGLPHHRAWN